MRVKVGLVGNMFVLRLQKVRVFWLLWLLLERRVGFVYVWVYLSIFFVVVRLVIIRDISFFLLDGCCESEGG